MKNLIKDLLMSLGLFFATLMIELAVSIVLQQPDPTKVSEAVQASSANMMFLVAAPFIGLAAYGAAMILKPSDRARVLRMSILWTLVFVGLNLLTGLTNNTMPVIFSGIGVFAAAIMMFLGPLLYGVQKKLR